MTELWKDIDGYEGLYQVSNLGNVRSLKWRRTKTIKNLCLKRHNKGYLQVGLTKDNVSKMYLVHRLVAQAFMENPNNYECINHKDENKQNNIVENLEWCTKAYNNQYSRKKHCFSKRRGKEISKNILQLDLENRVIKIWENSRTIFLETGMKQWSISECCRGNRNQAYGYKWQYAVNNI